MGKVRLGDIATVITKGTTPTSLGYDFVDEGINFVKIESITEDGNFIKDKFAYITYECNKKLGRSQLQKNDILFSIAGAIGRIAIVDESILPANTNQALAIIRIPEGIYDYDFLKYILKSPMISQQFEKQKQGVAQINLSLKNIGDLEVPVLPIEEQKRIAYELDKVIGIIYKRKEQLSKLDELVKARFVELFGHQSHNEKNMTYGKIDDVAEIYLGLTHTPTYVENGVKFISAKNTSCDYLDLSDVKYISREEFEKAPKGTKPQIGDVLFSRVGSNLGHPVILDVDEELCTFVSLGFLRTKGQVTNVYLKHWMRDDFFAEQVAQKVVGGGQPNLNTGWLKEFKIIIPPMALQNEFTAFVEQTDKSKLEVQKSLEKLELLKKALMQKYFG